MISTHLVLIYIVEDIYFYKCLTFDGKHLLTRSENTQNSCISVNIVSLHDAQPYHVAASLEQITGNLA